MTPATFNNHSSTLFSLVVKEKKSLKITLRILYNYFDQIHPFPPQIQQGLELTDTDSKRLASQ